MNPAYSETSKILCFKKVKFFVSMYFLLMSEETEISTQTMLKIRYVLNEIYTHRDVNVKHRFSGKL